MVILKSVKACTHDSDPTRCRHDLCFPTAEPPLVIVNRRDESVQAHDTASMLGRSGRKYRVTVRGQPTRKRDS